MPDHNCQQVMHAGELVWACGVEETASAEEIAMGRPAVRSVAATEEDETLFNKLKAALPKIQVPSISALFSKQE